MKNYFSTMVFKLVIIVHLTLLSTAYGVPQTLTFYSQMDQQGNSVTWRENIGDLTNYKDIINSEGSYSAVGWWHCFAGKNFTAYDVFSHGHGFTERNGSMTANMAAMLSCRHNGATDTHVQALSIYDSQSMSGGLNGTEILITGPAYAGVPFTVIGYSTTGWSNWTLFEGPNFDGKAMCFTSTVYVHEGLLWNVVIRSVLKNCLGRVDTYIYADKYTDLNI